MKQRLRMSFWRGPRMLGTLLALSMLSACTSGLLQRSENASAKVDDNIDKTLGEVCPLPPAAVSLADAQQRKTAARLHGLRAELFLALVAGYTAHSVKSYSAGDDSETDALLALQRLKSASSQLKSMNKVIDDSNHQVLQPA